MAADVSDVDKENIGEMGNGEGHCPISCPHAHDSDSGGVIAYWGESRGPTTPRKRSRESPSNIGSRGGNARGIRARGRAR